MGFEYGYSVERPDALVMWEAQFGDFANGGQSVIDEFVASGEQKWGQRSGVVLLLPHGYEGQGPDHSSGRIERFLSLSAQNNMTVAMPSVPSNYFHLLRWQALNGQHKPLIVFTPKSMLRLKAATSGVEEFTTGTFRPVIGDSSVDPAGVRRVLLCSGKIAYDLEAARSRLGRTDTAIIRVERLYPLPAEELTAALAAYPAEASLHWVQEEPLNQGAWPFMALHLPRHLGGRMLYPIARPESSAPAGGSHARHEREQAALIDQALGS
jgi:2-oxoglutarate dehydrogenase E1 component